jgi:hypothetical protein
MNIGEILLLILVVDRAGAADAVAPGKAGVHGAGLATAHGNPTESQDYKADVCKNAWNRENALESPILILQGCV